MVAGRTMSGGHSQGAQDQNVPAMFGNGGQQCPIAHGTGTLLSVVVNQREEFNVNEYTYMYWWSAHNTSGTITTMLIGTKSAK